MNRLQTGFPTRSIVCSLFSKCGGCSLQENLDLPPVWEILKDFFLQKGVFPVLISKEVTSYRTKVKLAVRGTFLSPQIGLFAKNTHEVIDLPSCPLHSLFMDKACSFIRKKIVEYKIEPYQEKDFQGRLRYIQFLANRKTNKIQLSLVFNSQYLEFKERSFIEDLYENSPFFDSIWVNFLEGSTNTIFGDKWEFIRGEREFWQEILGIEFNFHPSSFSQANLLIFEEMIKYIDYLVPERKNLLELYAGVGCIGLHLAKKSSNAVFVESSPQAEECFKKTLSKLPLEISSKCRFFSSFVENIDFSSFQTDVVIVDPPRKGLSKSCKEKIHQIRAKELIYISCSPFSFMRDAQEMVEKGWVLKEASGFLLFPGTDHAEIVAKFSNSFF